MIIYFDKLGNFTDKKCDVYSIKKEFKTTKELNEFMLEKLNFKNPKLNEKGEWFEEGETKEYLELKLRETDNFSPRLIEDLFDFVENGKKSKQLEDWVKTKKEIRKKFLKIKE